jgi:hypothetical protein
MAPYIAVSLVLTLVALLDVEYPRLEREFAAISLIVATGFAALRYQTGYDWLTYEAYFDSTADLETALYRGIPHQDTPMEPLFYGLNMLIKSLGGSLVLVFAIAAIFNCGVIHAVTGRISDGRCLMWTLYFALAFPIAQLSIIRQSLAASFVLIALLLAAQGIIALAILVLLIGAGFHASTLIYLPIVFLPYLRPKPWSIILAAGFGICLLFADVRLLNPAIDLATLLLPQWLANKLSLYYQIEPPNISLGVAALILWHCGILGLMLKCLSESERRCPYIGVAFWLTLWVLGAHIYLAGFPNLWNRVMCVALPWQVAALWRLDVIRRFTRAAKVALVAALGTAGLVGLVYTLQKPDSAPLVPYHSLVQLWLYGDPGDGRTRSELWLEEYNWINWQKRQELSDR